MFSHMTIGASDLPRAIAAIDIDRHRQARRRLHAAGNAGDGAPLVILDAGYSAAALTAGLRGCPVAVRAGFALRALLPLGGQGLFLLAFYGDGPCVFRRLYRFPRGHGHRLRSRLARLIERLRSELQDA